MYFYYYYHYYYCSGTSEHVMSDFSPSVIYEYAAKNVKTFNTAACFTDELLPIVDLLEKPQSRHDLRMLLQAW